MLLIVLLSPLSSSALGAGALVIVPTALAILAFEPSRPGNVVLALILLAGAALGFRDPTALWHAERGWATLLAGGFAICLALAPSRPILERSLWAVAMAGGVAGGLNVWSPGLLAAFDRQIIAEFDRALAAWNFRALGGLAVAEAAGRAAALWRVVHPALLVLASLAALALTEYVIGRMRETAAALPPMREFRFSEHLAWLLILGLLLVVLPFGDGTRRAGANVVTAMSGLYLLRGTAVLVWLLSAAPVSRGVRWAWGAAAVLLYPVTAGAALVVGISDTWLDLRSRLGVVTNGD